MLKLRSSAIGSTRIDRGDSSDVVSQLKTLLEAVRAGGQVSMATEEFYEVGAGEANASRLIVASRGVQSYVGKL